jgi:hypothetical protein
LSLFQGPAGGPRRTFGGADSCCEAAADAVAGGAGQSIAAGSRRRRLWELARHAHCPLVGVAFTIPELRRLVARFERYQCCEEDYSLHSGVVAECQNRTALAELMQQELDRRHAQRLRQVRALKSTASLAQWWRENGDGGTLPGALWAVLTHPRCDVALEAKVLGEVHMRQHQLGATSRTERQQLDRLAEDRAALAAEVAALRERVAAQAAEAAARIESLQAQLAAAGVALVGRDATIDALRTELAGQDMAPGLSSRRTLEARLGQAQERIDRLQQALAAAEASRREAAAARVAAEDAVKAGREATATVPAAAGIGPACELGARAVLCVGGRTASVPIYRRMVEARGARFLHHDGGEEAHLSQLDATLAAADLVICQTGCVSHNAYWRVKDHCKRTGKRCVFVDSPSAAGLARALTDIAASARVAS